MIALPIYLQMVLEYDAMEAGLSIAPLSLSMFAVALVAGKRAGRRSPSRIIRLGFLLLVAGVAVLIPIVPRADSGWAMAVPLLIAGAGLGLLVSQLNNYTLSPIEEERVSEAAGVNSAGGSFGLSFGLAFAGAIMLASLSLVFTNMAESSDVLSPAEQQQVADGLEENAEVMTNTHLEELLAGQPADVQEEILEINTDARPIALQIALLIPLVAALLGLLNGFRMTRLPDPEPSSAAETLEPADGWPNRSTSRRCRRPRSLTVSDSRPSLSSTVRTTQAPARMTSARFGWRPTISRRSSALRVRNSSISRSRSSSVELAALHDLRVVRRRARA